MRSTSLDEGGSSRPAIAGRGRRRAALPHAAVVAAAASSAVLVGHDGSPGWRLVRVVVVLVVAAVAATVVRRRGVGPAALGGGALVLAVGAGFLPHLVKRGATPVGLAALAAVLAGLVLVGASVVQLGGRRWPRRVGAAAAGLVVTGLTAIVVGPAVAATNVPRPDIGADPSSVGLDYEEVELPADAGVRLAAWYVPTSNGAAVVLRHGAGSTRSSVLRHTAVLAEHGYGVLVVDARGHGRSTGRAMDFGWWGDADVAAAVEHLAGRAEVDADRIGVVGLSMGGEEAIGATAALPQIRAVVAEGATARSAGDEAWLSDVHGVRGWLQEQLEVV
ncbi:MAG: alpha/beta hydrolase [Actinomycetota bacterium]